MKKKRLLTVLSLMILLVSGCGKTQASEPTEQAADVTGQTADAAEQTTVESTEQKAAEDTAPAADSETDSQDDTEGIRYDKVADSADMTEVESVVQEWMTPITGAQVKDGSYYIQVDSSSSMFQIADCTLTVANGEMTAAMTMSGTGYLCLYMGTGEEAAQADPKDYIAYEETGEETHTFTVPVKALDEELSCAAFSRKKQMWYDRTLVFRSDTIKSLDDPAKDAFLDGTFPVPEGLDMTDGEYDVDVKLYGGSGKASIESPAKLRIEDGKMYATLTWSSSHYDYMLVNGERYEPVNTEGNSTFEIPVPYLYRPVAVVADTTAMSEPHEIDYTLYFTISNP